MLIDREFIRAPHGLLHLRRAAPDGPASPGRLAPAPPLVMLHASPASSLSLEPLLVELAGSRPCLAPDTPGFGDSAPLPMASPAIADYAQALWHATPAPRVDLYGFHTGAHIAFEMALLQPARVRCVVLDGLLVLDDAERAEYLARYAPPIGVDEQGSQFFRALLYIRDQAWFFPHFRRDAQHNLRGGAMPPAVLHMLTLDLLKALGTYHLAYQAVFRHRVLERVAQLRCPVFLLADAADPTRDGVAQAAARVAHARHELLGSPGDSATGGSKSARIREFLDAPPG